MIIPIGPAEAQHLTLVCKVAGEKSNCARSFPCGSHSLRQDNRGGRRSRSWPSASASTDTSRVLRLTLLAPDIVEAILEGRQPEGMRLEDLLKVSVGVR